MATKVPLKELCAMEITDGTHKTPTYSDQGYIFLSSKNVTSEKIDWDNVMYIPENLHQELHQRLAPQKDDILLAKNGTTGVAAIVDRDIVFDIYVSLALIRPNQEKVIPKYLLYAINSDSAKRYFKRHLKGVGVPNLHLTHIRETPIIVPNINAQREVVKKLDKVSDLIVKRRQQLDKLDEMVKARFEEMFGDPVINPMGWEQTTLKELAVGKLSYGSGASAVNYDGIVRYIRITDITDDGELNNDIKSPNQFDEKYLLRNGDILFARSGATVGKTLCYSQEKHGKAIYAGYLIRMIPDSTRVLPIYIFYYTKTSYYSSFISVAQKAVAQPNINAQEYGNLLICVPPLEVQKQFAAFVEQTEKTKTTISRSLDKLETLKKALMQEYFG